MSSSRKIRFVVLCCFCNFKYQILTKINSKFRVPRKQGAHFLGAWAQIQDSWASKLGFLSSFNINIKFLIDRVPSCPRFEIWDFGQIGE
jgi:hypothetical protein